MADHTSNPNSKISYNVICSGRVQGVGFRYTAQRFAADLGLGGWVKNLPDGRVELCVEGEPARFNELLARLGVHFLMQDVQVSEAPASGIPLSFEIKY